MSHQNITFLHLPKGITMTGWNWRLGGWRTMKLEGGGKLQGFVERVESHYIPYKVISKCLNFKRDYLKQTGRED